MTDTFADEVTATLLERRRQGLCAEPVSMRGALAEDDQGVFAVVDVLLTSGELLRFKTRDGLQGEMH